MCGGLHQQGFLAPCKPEALSLCLSLSLRRLGGRVWAVRLYLGVWRPRVAICAKMKFPMKTNGISHWFSLFPLEIVKYVVPSLPSICP